MAWENLKNGSLRGKNRRITIFAWAYLLLITVLATQSLAGVDMTVFGPKRYDRTKGAPNVYTDTFERCNPSSLALLRVTNGDGKSTSITAGRIYVNGTLVVDENDFKQQTYLIEKPLAVMQTNELKVELKSSSRDTSFVIIEIIGKNCDSTPPVISASSPADGALLKTPRPTISASYSDESNGSGINTASVTMVVDGTDVTASASVGAGSISYTPTSDLPDKTHTVTVTVADRASNSSSLPWGFTTDTVAPSFGDITPAPGSFLNTPVITISGTINDPQARVTLNGIEATVSSGRFNMDGFRLHEGSNTINIVAVDKAGNEATGSFTLNLDTVSPTIDIRTPVKDLLTNKAPVTVSGKISEELTSVTVNGVKAQATGTDYSFAYTLSEGRNTLTAVATDRAKNTGSYSIEVTLDSIAPDKPVLAKLATPTNVATVTVNGTAEAASTVRVSRGGALVGTVTADAAGNFTLPNVTLNEGDNTFSATATDAALNESQVSDPLTATLDTVRPVVKITSHAEGQFLNTPTVVVSGTLDDATARVTVNGQPAAATAGGFELAGFTLTEGANTVSANAVDPATNSGTDSITVNLDTVAPTVTITSPVNNLLTNKSQVTVSGTISEEFTTVTVNGLAASVQGKEYTLSYNLVEGLNTITVIATDRAQNKGTAGVVVNLDSIAPAKPVLEKLKTPTNVGAVVINGTAEAGSTVKIARGGALLGTVTADSTGHFTLPNVTLNEGDNTFSATATDAALNESQVSDPLTATLDTVRPVVKITSHAEGQFLNTPTVTVSGTVDDPTAEVTVNGRMAEKTGGGFSLAGVSLVELANTLTVRAVDPAGNIGTDSVTVNLDTIAPVITVTYPVADSFLKTPGITVAGGINEPVTEVTVNGAAAKLEGQSFTLPVTLAEGPNGYTVRAKDRAGNEGSIVVPVNLDTVAPVVTITAPANGLLTSKAPVTVTGTLSEDFTTVTVNKIPAAVSGKSFTLAYTLTEGDNTLTVEATDRAGNPGSSSVTVTLDSTAPEPPILDPIKTPTNVATLSIKGKAEPNATVKISAGGALIGTVVTDAQRNFSLDNVALTEGENTFSATAADKAGNESGASTVKVVLDTVPPVITVTAPAADSFLNTPQISVTGSVNEALLSLTVNDQAVTATGTDFQHSVTLAQGPNTITVVATDLAGNPATKTVPVNLDTTAPVVTITAPVSGASTNAKVVTVTGTISEDFTTATINGTAVTVANQAFSFAYTMHEGDNTLTVEATDRAGNKGSASVTRMLDSELPVVSVVAPAEAAAGANVTILVNGSDNALLNLAELKVDGVAIWSATTGPLTSEPVSYRLSPTLKAGTEVQLAVRGVDHVGNQGSATASIKITQSADGPGYIQGKVLNDQRGLLLAGAEVTITDAKGVSSVLTTAEDGGYFAEAAAGSALIRIANSGYTTVERIVTVLPELKSTVLDARLTPLSGKVNLVDSAGAQIKVPLATGAAAPAAEVVVPAGALGVQADLRLTQLGNQGLPGVLPAGWSPIAAADLRLYDSSAGTLVENPPRFAATLKFPVLPVASLSAATPVVLAAYDAASHVWVAKSNAVPAADASSVSAAVDGVGKYALLVADPAPNAPTAAEQGKSLSPAATAAVNFDLTRAAGKVLPQASPPATGLRAAGELVLSAADGADPAPQFTSGLVVSSRVTERFDLHSGDRIEPPVYNQDLVLYRVPCVTNIGQGALTEAVSASLRATFPISPSKDFTIVDLLLGKVGIDILRPDVAADGGVMVGTDGARLLDSDGNVLVIPPGALSQTVPVVTRNAKPAAGAVGSEFTLIKAVELNLTRQTLASSATISIPLPEGLDPALPLLVAKGVDVKGVTRLKLVAVAKTSGSFISSDLTAAGITLPGITTSGVYYFLQGKGTTGFVSGTVTGATGTAFRGALVKTDTGSLIDLSAASGSYLLAAPAGAFNATAIDLGTNDEGSSAGSIGAAYQAVTVNLSIQKLAPRVLTVTPADQAVNVQPSTQVVVTFSKRMDKTSITSSTLKVAKSDGSAVAGVISFNVDGTAATFYPEAALESEAAYRVTVDAAIKDVQGYSLGTATVANFTVRKTTPPPMPPAGAISATFPDEKGEITVTGTQGSAPPDNTVMVINDTTGEIASFPPAADGSFTWKVRAQLGDEIKVVLMDRSGNQTVVSYITFKSPDGRYLVTAKGGRVEGEGGSLLEIPEDALSGPAIVKVTTLQQAALPSPVQAPGSFLAAVNIDTGGASLRKDVVISVPMPAGFDPKTPVFITRPSEIISEDGKTTEKVYEIVDSTKIVGDRISSACEPFPGVWLGGPLVFTAFVDMQPIVVSGYTYQQLNDLPSYQAPPEGVVEVPTKDPVTGDPVFKYDRPVARAVIRSPDAWNFVSYTNSKGFYGTFASLAVLPPEFAGPDANCKRYRVTATHPATMKSVTMDGYACAPPYNVRNINFQLADKGYIPADKDAPVIMINATKVEGQSGDASYTNGVATVGTELAVEIIVADKMMGATGLTMEEVPDEFANTRVTSLSMGEPTVSNAWGMIRYSYPPDFGANYASPNSRRILKPMEPGLFRIIVDARDAAGNTSRKSLDIRVVKPGEQPASVDGPPRIDWMSPGEDATEVKIDTPVSVLFSEAVTGVNETSFSVYDLTAGRRLEATVTSDVSKGRMKAMLVPKGNLSYGHTYQVEFEGGISDIAPNPSANGTLLSMEPRKWKFTTKTPLGGELAGASFAARDIDYYNDPQHAKRYAYVAAGTEGWRVVDVTDLNNMSVVYPRPDLGIPSSDFTFNARMDYRHLAVDQENALMAMTDNYNLSMSEYHFGYVRFYSLADPKRPVIVGREKLAEAYSGIPLRVSMQNGLAYVCTVGVGIQIVDIQATIDRQNEGDPSDGSAIVGYFDTNDPVYYGAPMFFTPYRSTAALMTTTTGHLLALDLSIPSMPSLLKDFQPEDPNSTSTPKAKLRFGAMAVTADFGYRDGFGGVKMMDLAVVGLPSGGMRIIDLTQNTDPAIIGTVKYLDGSVATMMPRDITINPGLGFAVATALDGLYVIDIRNPSDPRVMNKITEVATSGGDPTAVVKLDGGQALVEKDGKVYIAVPTTATSGVSAVKALDLGAGERISCNPNRPCDP